MEWLPGLLDLLVRTLQVCASLVLAYGAYLAIRHAGVLPIGFAARRYRAARENRSELAPLLGKDYPAA